MSEEAEPATGDPHRAASGSRPVWALITDREAFGTIDVFRLLYVAVAVVAFLLTEAGRFIYRPYIYDNGITDFGIADSMGNLGGIVVQVFFSLAVLNSHKRKAFNVIGFLVVGFILYEFVQPILPKGVFDWKDVYGTIVGGVVSVAVVAVLRLVVKHNRVFIQF